MFSLTGISWSEFTLVITLLALFSLWNEKRKKIIIIIPKSASGTTTEERKQRHDFYLLLKFFFRDCTGTFKTVSKALPLRLILHNLTQAQ